MKCFYATPTSELSGSEYGLEKAFHALKCTGRYDSKTTNNDDTSN